MRIIRGPALVAGLAVAAAALAGCGSTGPGRPAQCGALLAQLKAFDGTLQGEAKGDNPLAEVGTSASFQMQLRRDAASPAVPQALWTAETSLSGALQAYDEPGVKTALEQVKAVCGG